jgi:enolase
MADRIISVRAQQIIDCKCRPAVEVEICTESGGTGRGAAPTGTSVGMHEAFVLRDGDPATYNGLSVHKAVAAVETTIAPAIIGMDVADQRAIDFRMIELDGPRSLSTVPQQMHYGYRCTTTLRVGRSKLFQCLASTL